ncbi:MAG: Short-chain reductase protein NovJ [Spirochaetes bacterium ADurb.Bin110]|nr:MAG: Short-chain reductase protein NovJ [Spirochaetes bacterium ADurb.Bin110]
MKLDEVVAVITGGASGIGEAVAKYLASHGAKIIIADVVQESIERVVKEIQAAGGAAAGLKTDVTKDAEVAGLMDFAILKFGAINVVVPCAGIIRDAVMINIDKETGKVKRVMETDQFRSVIEVNLIGSFITLREAARRMVDHKWQGVLFTISSVNKAGQVGQINYASTKAAVAVWPRILVGEFQMKGIKGIRAMSIAPGYVGTPMVKGMNQDALADIIKDIHIGRLVEPEEIAQAIAMIIENEAFDGTCLEITGGVTYGARSIAK